MLFVYSSRFKAAAIIALAMVGVAALIWLYFYNPENNVWAPKCMIFMFTGLECPGCGSGRAMHHLLHLRFGQAMYYNPFFVAAMPYVFALIWLQYAGGRRHFARLHSALTGRAAIITVLVASLLWGILRNII